MTITLDKGVLLSESQIWQQQSDFYRREGASAWENKVPFYATSNAFIAHAYADMIMSFMQDWHKKHGSTCFKILELGAGCGQFSYLCLQALTERPHSDDFSWQYIMSDLDDGLISFWQQHRAFKAFMDAGQVAFSKGVIGSDTGVLNFFAADCDAPLIVIANYLFDSLPADIYKVGNETLRPVRVTITTGDTNVDESGAVEDFEKLSVIYLPDLTDQPSEDPILNQYRLELLDSHILYPRASLILLEALLQSVPEGVFLLTTDKAYVHADELDYLDYPEITGHGGCFSLMANYDAIRRFAELNNGSAYLPSTRAGIKTAAFSLGFELNGFMRLPYKLNRYIQEFSAAEYLHLYRNIQKKTDGIGLEAALSFLALSQWDAMVFKHLYNAIYDQLNGADMLSVTYLREHLPIIANHYYKLDNSDDILFQIAVLFHTLKDYTQAITCYRKSLEYFEPNFGLLFNMGVCYYHLNQLDQAKASFEKAQRLDPADAKTREWLSKLT